MNIKSLKRISALLLAFCIMFSVITSSSFAESSNQPPVVVNSLPDEKTIQFSNDTNEQYNKLTEHWDHKFPSYYAGAYLKDFKFYILVTCDPSSVTEEICKVTGNPNVIVQQVKYSYDYLATARDELVTNICELQTKGDKTADLFIGFGVDEINNRVFVEVLDNDYINNKSIYDMIEYDEIVDVIIKDKSYSPYTDINAGSKDWVVNASNGSMSTIGFCASRVNSSGVTELGFVIAGHAGNLYNQMRISGTTVGTVAARQYGGNCDAAFVNLDIPSSYVRSRKLSTSYTIDGSSAAYIVGSSLTMHGMTSGIISGIVNNTSFSFTMDGISFTDHVRMQMSTSGGDSGGPLVKQNSGYSRSVIGILSGGDGTYSNFTKFYNIASNFNLMLYN